MCVQLLANKDEQEIKFVIFSKQIPQNQPTSPANSQVGKLKQLTKPYLMSVQIDIEVNDGKSKITKHRLHLNKCETSK